MSGACLATATVEGKAELVCMQPRDHIGPHWDSVDRIFWHCAPDDPPEDDPDGAEAQRIAEEYADAAAELARIEAEEARGG